MHELQEQNPSIVPEDQMLAASRALASLKLALAFFPWLGVWNRRLIAADTLQCSLLSELLVMWEPLDISP